MVRLLSSLLVAFGLLAYMPVDTASAQGSGNGQRGTGFSSNGRGLDHVLRAHERHGGRRFERPSGAVPELDPTAAAGVLTLLAGGALVLGGKRRRRA